jgi:glycosyltransferase involved in cell wall biosynthesis
MHICFNALDYPSAGGGGGVGNQVRMLARGLVEAGCRVSVIALAQKGLPVFSEDDGIRVHRVPCGNLHWHLSRLPLHGRLLTLPVREIERSWALWRRLRAVHKTQTIDVVEGTETGMLLTSLGMSKIPFLCRLHGEPYTFVKHTPGLTLTAGLRLCRALQRAALRRARRLVSPSRAHAQEIAGELGRRRPRIEVVPNMLAPEMVEAADAAPGVAGEPIRGRIVLYVGRLERNKGVATLLAAARGVLDRIPDAHLVLAGGRHPNLSADELEGMLRLIPHRSRVHVLGHVPWTDLFPWYRRAAVSVLASHYETFGLAALEPMAFGVPVVAAAAGGLPEIVEDETSGLLIPPGDEAALVQSVARLLTDDALRRRLGEAARERARGYVRTAAHIEANLEIYRRVCDPTNADAARGFLVESPRSPSAALTAAGSEGR